MREKRIVEADPEITEMLELAGSLKQQFNMFNILKERMNKMNTQMGNAGVEIEI